MSQVDYGKALRVARAARGMKKNALAWEIGVSPTFVSYLENGKRRPGPDVLEQLAAALRLPTWALVYLGTPEGPGRAELLDGVVLRLLQNARAG